MKGEMGLERRNETVLLGRLLHVVQSQRSGSMSETHHPAAHLFHPIQEIKHRLAPVLLLHLSQEKRWQHSLALNCSSRGCPAAAIAGQPSPAPALPCSSVAAAWQCVLMALQQHLQPLPSPLALRQA